MSRKQIISLGAVAVVLVAVIGMSVVSYAASGDDASPKKDHSRFDSEEWQEKKAERQNQKEFAMAAIESGDYQAWLEAVGADSKVAQIVSEDEFPRLLESYNLMQDAKEKMEQARQIKEELGFKMGKGEGKFGKFRSHFGHGMNKLPAKN